jgi:hypothetical protein
MAVDERRERGVERRLVLQALAAQRRRRVQRQRATGAADTIALEIGCTAGTQVAAAVAAQAAQQAVRRQHGKLQALPDAAEEAVN